VLRRPLESTQYTSIAFGSRCRDAGVRPSMGSIGDCFDNAMCESFFATLECELLAKHWFPTQTDARIAVFEFIEGWYNTQRRHSSLGQIAPITFERRNAPAHEVIPTGNGFVGSPHSHVHAPA
jgi:putative transposase